MDTVSVLMSTYNGHKYLKQQIDSILNQRDINVLLYIRDDQSSDNTCKILAEYEKLSNVHVYYGNHLGVIESFEWLINNIPIESNYFAFSDQDDIWYKNKLCTAVDKIKEVENKKNNKLVLYACNQNCVDKDGNFRMLRLPKEKIGDNVIDSLIQTEYPACSMVFTKMIILKMRYTYKVAKKDLRTMHDAWALIMAQLMGTFIYDPQPLMDFRRHDENYTQGIMYGARSIKDSFNELKYNLKVLKKYKYYQGRTAYRARLLIHCFGDKISEDDYKNLMILGTYNRSFQNWLRMIISNPLRRYYNRPYWKTWLKFAIRIY